MDRICYVYRDLILKGAITLADVPLNYRADVEALLQN